MDRKTLQSIAVTYPYLRGLWALPFGVGIIVAGISNLQRRPAGPVMLGIAGASLLLCLGGCWLIANYYRENYGEVTSTRTTQLRYAVAIVAWIVVLSIGGSKYLFWSLDSDRCVYASAFALATMVYYAILVRLRTYHLVLWGALFVAGLLPIWGGLGEDRDAVAMMIFGVFLIVSGLLDQRLLARSFGPSGS